MENNLNSIRTYNDWISALKNKVKPVEDNKNVSVPSGVDIDELAQRLRFTGALMLLGVPGTGKTIIAKHIASNILFNSSDISKLNNCDEIGIISFAGSYANEHYVFRAVNSLSVDSLNYIHEQLEDFCWKALNCKDKDKKFILILDECSRGDAAQILAEAVVAMEYRNTIVNTIGKRHIVIPDNVYIISIVNYYGSTIPNIDKAVLERFDKVIIEPQWNVSFYNDYIKKVWTFLDKLNDENHVDAVNKAMEILMNYMGKVNNHIRNCGQFIGSERCIGTRYISRKCETLEDFVTCIRVFIQNVQLEMIDLKYSVSTFRSNKDYMDEFKFSLFTDLDDVLDAIDESKDEHGEYMISEDAYNKLQRFTLKYQDKYRK